MGKLSLVMLLLGVILILGMATGLDAKRGRNMLRRRVSHLEEAVTTLQKQLDYLLTEGEPAANATETEDVEVVESEEPAESEVVEEITGDDEAPASEIVEEIAEDDEAPTSTEVVEDIVEESQNNGTDSAF